MNLARHLGALGWAVAARLLPLISGLGIILLVIPHLSVAEFGRYSLIFNLAIFLILLNKSLILNPTVKFGAEPRSLEESLQAGLTLNAFFYLLMAVLLGLSDSFFHSLFRLERGDILLVGIIPIAFLLRDWGFVFYQVRYQMFRIFLLDSIYFIGIIVGYYLLVRWGFMHSAKQVIMINIVCAIASSLWALGNVGISFPWRFTLDIRIINRIIGYGFSTLGLGLVGILLYTVDTAILGAIYHPEIVGIYSGGRSVYRVISLSITGLGTMVLPYASKLHSEGRTDELRALYEKVVGYLFVVLTIFALLLILFSESIFLFLFGERYIASASVLQILCIGAPLEGIFTISSLLLYGAGWGKLVNRVALWVTALLPFLVFWGSYWAGPKGAALGMVITMTIGMWQVMKTAHSLLGTSVFRIFNRVAVNIRTVLKSGI
ncbi:MAG: lipopolysaccharide biosynthesis protein [bacterium]